MPYCMNCGKELDGGKFCPNCGAPAGGPGKGNARKPAKGLRARDLIEKGWSVFRKKPVRLWGVMLLCCLLCAMAVFFGVLPIISIPIVLVLGAGMLAIFLSGYRGEEVRSDALFFGFHNFWHVAGGMSWMALWIVIWGLIPIVGPVFAVIKAYSYRFTPFILISEPEIPATEALRVSMRKTEGFKGRMFLADFLVSIVCIAVLVLFGLLAQIRHVGGVFMVLGALAMLATHLFLPLLLGLIAAAGYEEIYNKLGKEEPKPEAED